MARSIALAALLYALPIAARTNYDGCTSFTSTVTVRPEPGYGNTYEKVMWYVSDTLEICEGVDCGGGRAPPRSVPGCPLYKGTETVTPRFLDSDPMAEETAIAVPLSRSGSVLLGGTWYAASEATVTDTADYTGTAIASAMTTDASTITKVSATTTEAAETTDVESLTFVTDSPKATGHKNATATSGAGSEDATDGSAKPSSVDVDNAGAGVMVKAAGVLAAVAGAVVMAL
ncbi:hypothetical protein NW768_010037 [Fusarium equiseti]|uniref:Siderophore biosynthesis protein n=1 Tax=Fusarium equiseti TaxID=61235 RepID=A0ABQ8R1N5_FUSEQ|nr:hypothetical protein NW768_010037 [Fusarium equiseti]